MGTEKGITEEKSRRGVFSDRGNGLDEEAN